MKSDSARRKLKVVDGLDSKKGILLDIGCGETVRPGFIRLDMRDLPGIDIVHNLEEFPYPLNDESCLTIVGSHIIEHIKPWLMFQLMDELWRILKYDGQLALSMPYGVSGGFIQDPTHCNACNEATWQYFDPRFPLYQIYKPKPWKIDPNSPSWQVTGNMEVLMWKIEGHEFGKVHLGEKDEEKGKESHSVE